MKVEADQLDWNETTGVLHLLPWSRLTRDQTMINAGPSMVVLKDKHIDCIDTVNAHGTDQQPARQIEYSADAIHVSYNDRAPDGQGHRDRATPSSYRMRRDRKRR